VSALVARPLGNPSRYEDLLPSLGPAIYVRSQLRAGCSLAGWLAGCLVFLLEGARSLPGLLVVGLAGGSGWFDCCVAAC
jgi:hypothetical protein